MIGIYIGVLAVVLAICSMGGGNAAKDAMLKNIEASNTWAFFQAKNMRRQVLRMRIDELELHVISDPALPEAARKAITDKIAAYRKHDVALTSDPDNEPDKREGLDQLFLKGKALEAARDVAIRRDPYFDYGQAFLQISIVLASVALISSGSALLVASVGLGLLGASMTLNGFTLLFAMPGIG
jgi:hypothetical protein